MPTLNNESKEVVELRLNKKGDSAVVTIAGTYDMTINLQREVGSPRSGAWETIKHWKKNDDKDATVKHTHVALSDGEGIRLVVADWVSGSAEVELSDPLVEEKAKAKPSPVQQDPVTFSPAAKKPKSLDV